MAKTEKPAEQPAPAAKPDVHATLALVTAKTLLRVMRAGAMKGTGELEAAIEAAEANA